MTSVKSIAKLEIVPGCLPSNQQVSGQLRPGLPASCRGTVVLIGET